MSVIKFIPSISPLTKTQTRMRKRRENIMVVVHLVIISLLLLFSKSRAIFLPLNSSILPQSLNPDSLLNEALKAIAVEEGWDPNGGVRVSNLDPISLKVGRTQRYEFHVRVGKTVLMLKLSDGDILWRKPKREWVGFGSDFGFGEDPKGGVRGLELEGPLDLRVGGGGDDDDDEMELVLPSMNVRHGGLRRMLVGDGITIKVEGAQEITLIHSHDIGLSVDRRSVKANRENNQFWAFSVLPSCYPLLSVRVVGSASIVAFYTHNSESHVKFVFHTDDTIELLSDKCYINGRFMHVPSWIFGSLRSKLVLVEKALMNFLGKSILRRARLLKAKITSSNLLKFKLEVEKDITENDRIWKRVAEWRTKPVVERTWFEIMARVEEGKGWKQMVIRKLTRPIMSVESSPWSNLMSNMSFTEIPSIVLPPEALTLDVNW